MLKIGPHVQRTTGPAKAWAQRAPIVKGVDNVEILAVAPPNAWRIFRHRFLETEQRPDADPQWVAATILNALGGYRHPKLVVEIFNEIRPIAAYIPLLTEVTRLLHGAGLLVALPGWATGDYGHSDWGAMRAAGWCGADSIALHAYWASEGFSPWNALRYRTYWREGDPPIFVVECFRDRVRDGNSNVYDGYVGKGGWKADGLSPEQGVAELEAYDKELQKDPYVLGATVFGAGPEDDWAANFGVDELEPLIKYEEEVQPVTTMDRTERILRDMWRRQGVEPPANGTNAFWDYALRNAQGSYPIIPMPSRDGSFENHDDPLYAIAYTMPPLYAAKGVWNVRRGLPPKA